MAKRGETLKDFTSCFAVLSRIENADLKLDDLLKNYVGYLREKDNADKFLFLQINHLLNLLTNLDRFNGLPKKQCRLALKKLLFLKLKVINSAVSPKRIPVKKPFVPRKISKKTGKIKEAEQKIIDFIASKEKARNLEIFDNFKDLHPRSVKRYLSNLVGDGRIGRESKGKSVFYFKK